MMEVNVYKCVIYIHASLLTFEINSEFEFC
jgi:hypothetical protein